MGILTTLAATSSLFSGSYSDEEELINALINDSSALNTARGLEIWGIIAMILSIVGGILIYFLFVKKAFKTENKFLVWLKNFFRFDVMTIEDIAKIAYICLALLITLAPLGTLFTGEVLMSLLVIIVGNIVVRVAFELTMITIMIWRNTTDMKKKLCNEKTKSEAKAEKEEKASKK